MSTLYELASKGTLTPNALQGHIDLDATAIDRPAGRRCITPLCAAVIGAHLKTVEMLLENDADPDAASSNNRTPLYFATTRKLKKNQVAIVRALLAYDASPNLCFFETTPLMNAIIILRDVDVARELIDRGADLRLKNVQDRRPEDHALCPPSEKISSHGACGLAAAAPVIGIRNSKTRNEGPASYILHDAGMPKSIFIPTATTASITNGSQPGIVGSWQRNITVEQVQKGLDDYLKEQKSLEKFFKPGDKFVTGLAKKAAALPKSTNSIYNKLENVKRLTTLSLYQPVLYCDDSESMTKSNRFDHQCELITLISRIATKILPDGYGVDLRFINDGCAERMSAEQVRSKVQQVRPSSGTMIGTNLRAKVLEPLVYKVLNSGKALDRPILVCTITDGWPLPESENVFKEAIVECRRKLIGKGYEPTAVMFLVSQIGDEPSAAQFLQTLRDDQNITDMLYCTSDRLDERFREFKANEDKLEEWLLLTLTRPLRAMRTGD